LETIMLDKLTDVVDSTKIFFKKILPHKKDDQDTKYFKITVFLIIGVFLTMVILTFLVFFMNLKGGEKTVVPNVTSAKNAQIDLISGILALQEKYLNFKIEMKGSSAYSRGIIMGQNPNPGTEVKMGRTINLMVSKGPVITKIEDYTGKTLAWLRYELQGAFASNEKALIEIREPIMYKYDDSEPGTILEQSPQAGTSINEDKLTYIDLVVSKGPKGKESIAEGYVGKHFEDVISKLAANNIMMVTSIDSEKNKYGEGIITSQNPESGEEVPYNTPIKLTVNPVVRSLGKDDVFGVFEYIMERYKVPVDIKIVAEFKNEKQTLISLKMEGGRISIPYVVKEGTELIVFLFEDKEMERYTVKESD
jgi:eukaryotic-like serine/threonine-protein kinase